MLLVVLAVEQKAVAAQGKSQTNEIGQPAVPEIDWEQDFEEAKKTAASEHKNVFIFFDASDAKESSYASGRFKEAVAKRDEFRKRADKEFVCVYIDNPKNAEAQDEVKDANRNGKLTEKFGIKVFPTVVVTDPKGRPFGFLEGYKINGINPFLALMDKWAADGKQLFALLAKFDAMPKESPNADLAGEVLDFLEMSKLDRFYAHTIKKAIACLPKGEGRPVTKELAEIWMRRLAMAARNPDEAKKVIDEFDQWKKTRTFKDREMGARLAPRRGLNPGAARPPQRGRPEVQRRSGPSTAQPHGAVLSRTVQPHSSVEPGKPVLMPVSSGTGYCIAKAITC